MTNPEEFRETLIQAADIIDGLMSPTEASPEARRVSSNFLLEHELRRLRSSHGAFDTYWDEVSGIWVS